MVESKFWKNVIKCQHKNLSPVYYEGIHCETPYCSGWETHCLDCGVFITKCGCGYNNSMSGWSERRHRIEANKKNEKQKRIKSTI